MPITSLVFLRALQYYEGIMILTTNRVGSFDSAFKSRIHLAIKYPFLSQDSRRKLWQTFLEEAVTQSHLGKRTNSEPELMTDENLNQLAEHELNGREIKNIVRTAYVLAGKDTDIKFQHVKIALDSLLQFESDFAESRKNIVAENGEDRDEDRRSKKRRIE